jgi:hypothetical protein
LEKDFTHLTKGAQIKTYPASHKLSLNQDKNTYTSGEQEQLIELSSFACAQDCNHDKLSIMV